ncbi:telomerase reverse transcriptase [Acrasis kona]|uniref:Telomerase reverse transcriptase n=1 Tax=Acrasis kona TaxID=1008807 RepID=A0AAW2Z8A8_9EUKA
MIFKNSWKSLYSFLASYSIKVEDHDLLEFTHSCFICVAPDSPPLSTNFSQDQTCAQSHLVDRVIGSIMLRGDEKYKHVLALGYSTPKFGNTGTSNLHGIQVCFPNTIVTTLKNHNWSKLLSKIGDDLMTYILTYCIVLSRLPNDCLLQLTGYEIFFLTTTYTVSNIIDEYVKKSNQDKEFIELKPSKLNRINIKKPKLKKQDPSTPPEDLNCEELQESQVNTQEQFKKKKCRNKKKNKKTKNENHSKLSLTQQKPKKSPSQTNPTNNSLALNSIIIPRIAMFFAAPTRLVNGFPYKNILNRIQCSNKGADILFTNIFKNENIFNDTKQQLIETPANIKGYSMIRKLLKQLKQNQIKMKGDFIYLLNRHCPIQHYNKPEQQEERYDKEGNEMSQDDVFISNSIENYNDWEMIDDQVIKSQSEDIEDDDRSTSLRSPSNHKFEYLINQHAHPNRVSNFIKSILTKIIPFEIWGSRHNQNLFLTSIDKFIRLGRFEKFNLKDAVQGMYVTDCEWTNQQSKNISSVHDLANPNTYKHEQGLQFLKRSKMLHLFVYFCFKSLVISLVRCYFYCTEMNQSRTNCHYYRTCIWQQIDKQSWSSLVCNDDHDALYQRVDQIANKSNLLLPIGNVRLLPKIKQKQWMDGYLKSTNSILKNILHVLKFENKRSDPAPPLLGSSVFNALDIYKRYLPFVKLWRWQQSHNAFQSNASKVYFVSVDVKSAFDSVPHDKLLSVMLNKVLKEDEYQIIKYNAVRPFLGRPSIKYERAVCTPDEFPLFPEYAKNVLSKRYSRSILTDKVFYKFMDREEIVNMLRCHVRKNYVVRGRGVKSVYYRQKKGIPQGSVLSPLMCSYFYADLEYSHLSDLPGTCSLVNAVTRYGGGNLEASHLSSLSQEQIVNHDDAPIFTPPNQILHNNLVWNGPGSPLVVVSTSSDSSGSEQHGNNISRIDSPWCYFSASQVRSPGQLVSPSPKTNHCILGETQRLLTDIASDENVEKLNASVMSSSSSSSSSGIMSQPLPIGVLLRLIDDFLYVTSSYESAKTFLQRYMDGFSDYGVSINPLKTKLGFECSVSGKDGVVDFKAEKFIRWCGYLFDTMSLEVMLDYSRHWSCHLKEKLSKEGERPGVNLAHKLKHTISVKCTPLIIDATLNSLFTSCLNVYQIFVFCAMKFHCFVRKSLEVNPPKDPTAPINHSSKFLVDVISDVIGYMWVTIESRGKLMESMQSKHELTEHKVQYMGLHAFHTTLNRKQSFYATRVPTLLSQLSCTISSGIFKEMLRSNKDVMSRVINPLNSQDLFDKIRF